MGVRGEQLPMASEDEQEELWDSDDEEVTPTAEEFPQIHSVERSEEHEPREWQQRCTLVGTEETPPLPMDAEWSRERVDITGQVSGPWSEVQAPEVWRDLVPRERWGQELPGPLEVEVLAPVGQGPSLGPETGREVVPHAGDEALQHQRSWVPEMKQRHRGLDQLPGEREEVPGESGGIEDWLRHVTAQRGAGGSESDGASETEPEGDGEAPSAQREAAVESSGSSAERRSEPMAEVDPRVLQTPGTVEHTEEQDGHVGVDMGVRGEQLPMASEDEQEELWDSDDEEVTPTADEFPQIHSVERSEEHEPREWHQRCTLVGTEETPPLPMDADWSRERVDITGQVSGPWSEVQAPEVWRDLVPRERWGQELPGPLEVEVLAPVGQGPSLGPETGREVVPPAGDGALHHQRSWVPEMEERHRGLDQLPGEREEVPGESGGIEDWLRHVTAQRGAGGSESDGASETEPEGDWEAPSAQREAAVESSGSSAERRSEPTAEVDPRVLQTPGTVEHTEEQGGRSEELSGRIRETAGRVRDVEKMLQHRSKNVSEAKEQQKRVWGELDRWHAILSRLDAEVQDLAEVDHCLAQQLMDALMDSFQEHQQAACTAEQRTTLVTKIPNCLEDYRQVTESATAWIQSTQAQLSDTIDCSNAKSLGKQLFTLQVMADTNGQKRAALQEVGARLREVGEMFETDQMVSRVEQLLETGASLQQAVSQKAVEVEYIATEIGAIESEVKIIESKLAKVNTILTAVDIEDLTAEEHLTNRQIVAENLVEMGKVADILSGYEHSLALPERAAGTVQAFARLPLITGQLAELQQLTTRQSGLLESLLEQLQECDTETERLLELQAGSVEDQQERLAVVRERRAGLVRDAQEALNEVTATLTDGQRSSLARREQPREPEYPQPASLPGKLSSLQEEDEDEEEDEETMEPLEECHPSAPPPPPPPDAEPQRVVGLNVCWERAATVERELASVGERLGAGVWSAAMHHSLQDSLLQSQTALTEIEERLACVTGTVLEQKGPELEALSQRLGSLRCSLTQLHARLEEGKLAAEELSHLCPTEEMAQQTQTMWPPDQPRCPGEEQLPAEARTRDMYRPEVGTPADPVPGPTLQRQIRDCWQQLQQETQGLEKLLEDSLQQGPEPQVFITVEGPCCVLRPAPDVEELNMWMAQLGEQGQSAAELAGQAEGTARQDACLRLEEAVQRTALGISEWVVATEQALGPCCLGPSEEAPRQLETLQVLAAALNRVDRGMAEPLGVLGQADIFSCALAGGSLSALHYNIQLLLHHCSLISDSIRPRAEQFTSCQEQLGQLQVTVSGRQAVVQQRLLESAACDTGEQLQWLEQMAVDLDSLDVELLSLRDKATRCDLGPQWMRRLEQLEEAFDGTMGLVGEQQAELAHSLVMGRLYQGLMQGTASLVELGQERLGPRDRLPTGTLADLRTHLHSHKLFYRGLEDHMIRAEQISGHVPERIVAEQRVVWLELEGRHRELQSQALRHGLHAETALQCWAELETEVEVLEKMLATLSSRLSDPQVVGEAARESSEGEMEYLHTCQEVCNGVEGSWPQMEEALRRGEVLLRSVDSPELEDKLQTMEDAWISVRDRAKHEVHSLSTKLQLRHRFGDECDAVTAWLDAAERRLERWGQRLPSGTEGQENQTNLFLDVWTGLEERRALQAAAVSRGQRLLAPAVAKSHQAAGTAAAVAAQLGACGGAAARPPAAAPAGSP
ncbi:nesprin-2-like [Rhinoraja longicauda]